MRRSTLVLLGAGALAAYLPVRRWFTTWGAEPEEVASALPGDELLPNATMTVTRAITIDAPPEAVWPWLVQMGQGRAGYYSYDWLESAFGLEIVNADEIVPDWQDLAVGEQLRAAPERAGPEAGFTVVAIDPGRSLVTAIGDPAVIGPQVAAGALPDGGTWAFVLRPAGTQQSRLLIRLRARFPLPRPAAWVVERLLEPVHFIMERKQLLGIRDRAGRRPAAADAPVATPLSPASASTG